MKICVLEQVAAAEAAEAAEAQIRLVVVSTLETEANTVTNQNDRAGETLP